MAKGNFNDLLYNELLTTPNYDLIFAIGTTYSLSLEAMLMIPISFGLLGEFDENIKQSPICLLEPIRKSADKFVIFCNKGSISVPNEIRNIYTLLEDRIVEVYNKKNPLSNFHPKLWIIKERNRDNGEQQIKIVVLSRNLSFDNSIDIACSLKGKISKEDIPFNVKHQPLKDMLIQLRNFTNKDKKKQINNIIKDLDKVEKFEIDNDVFEEDGYEFFPIWYGTDINGQLDLKKELKGNASIIISPFIDKTTLNEIKPTRSTGYRNILITRKNNIDEDIFNLYNEDGDIYSVTDTMLDNDIANIDLHAKIYWVYDRNNCKYLYLGSANATHSGFNRNTEFLLRLKYKKGKNYLYEDFLKNFINDEDRRFEKIDAPLVKESTNKYSDIDKILKNFIYSNISAVVDVNDTDNVANIRININNFDVKYKDISLSPLQLKNIKKNVEKQLCFENIPIDKISELYIVTLKQDEESKSAIIKIRTTGIPENRDDIIFSKMVDTPQKFIDYVSFMITDHPTEMISEMIEHSNTNGNSNVYDKRQQEPTVYEQMLKLAYDNPQQLKEIGDLMNKVNPDVITPQFKNMYEHFMSIIKTLERL